MENVHMLTNHWTNLIHVRNTRQNNIALVSKFERYL